MNGVQVGDTLLVRHDLSVTSEYKYGGVSERHVGCSFDMKRYAGETVTVSCVKKDYKGNVRSVGILEDEGRWVWVPEMFCEPDKIDVSSCDLDGLFGGK